MALSAFDLYSVGIGPSSSYGGADARGEAVRRPAGRGGPAVRRTASSGGAVRLFRRDPARARVYSVGGGFVVEEAAPGADRVVLDDTAVKFPFTTGAELLDICAREQLSVSDVMLADEQAWRSEAEVREDMLRLWSVMAECVENGFRREGMLPGGLRVPRGAPGLYRD